MSMYLSLVVCVAGALVYGYAANAKLAKLGEYAYFAGLLAFLLSFPKLLSIP